MMSDRVEYSYLIYIKNENQNNEPKKEAMTA